MNNAVLQRFSEGMEANAQDIAQRMSRGHSEGLATLAVQTDVLNRFRQLLTQMSGNDRARLWLAIEDTLTLAESDCDETRYGAYRLAVDMWGRRNER